MRFSKKSNNRLQLEKFKEAARELETDDDEGRFDAILKKVAKAGEKKPDDSKPDK